MLHALNLLCIGAQRLYVPRLMLTCSGIVAKATLQYKTSQNIFNLFSRAWKVTEITNILRLWKPLESEVVYKICTGPVLGLLCVQCTVFENISRPPAVPSVSEREKRIYIEINVQQCKTVSLCASAKRRVETALIPIIDNWCGAPSWNSGRGARVTHWFITAPQFSAGTAQH